MNDSCEDKLFHDSEDTERNYENLPIEKFKKPLKKELQSFVHVRMFDTASIPSSESKKIPSNKGKVEEAINGTPNLILAAFASRSDAKLLPRPETNEDGEVMMNMEDDDEVEEDGIVGGEYGVCARLVQPPRLIVECPCPTVTPPRHTLTKQPPSSFLSSVQYLQMANLNIRGTFRVEIDSVTREMKDHADKLGKALRRRLLKHIRTKIDDRTKHNHPALLFV